MKTNGFVDKMQMNTDQRLRFQKGGLFFLAAFGIYLGLQGLYLILIARNLPAGLPLFLAALMIAPPPVGIADMLRSSFGINIPMHKRIGITIIMLFISWLFLP
ncbi:MAG: hypothetical protein WBL02_01005 [Methanomethylovorans sp.]|uniref:hypothetical protein n=1 Tax=Methanomethylovorans sp. TaxID=2758717 RepID=UPI000B2FB259|nr:hypothetical protein [Methanomethylovorans sp.]